MYLRLYRPEDLESLTRLFFETIHTVNAGDYTPEQLWAWAPGAVDAARWNAMPRPPASLILPPTPPSPPGPSSLTVAIGPSGNSRWYGVLSCSPILSWKSRSPDRQCGTTGA